MAYITTATASVSSVTASTKLLTMGADTSAKSELKTNRSTKGRGTLCRNGPGNRWVLSLCFIFLLNGFILLPKQQGARSRAKPEPLFLHSVIHQRQLLLLCKRFQPFVHFRSDEAEATL